MCAKNEAKIIKVNNKKVFLSYCTDDKPIVDLIKDTLERETGGLIEISEYTEVKYKESFTKFMNSIQEHQFALCIVSDGYLKSQNCMYEVGEFISREGFEDKLLFVVLSDAEQEYYPEGEPYQLTVANIYAGFNSKIEYMLHWQDAYEKQKAQIKMLKNRRARKNLEPDLQKTKRIYEKDIGTFISFLADYNGKSFQELYSNNFRDLINYISPNEYFERFKDCDSYDKLLTRAIYSINEITKTDYNQIAVCLKTGQHQLGLVVVADDISEKKQKYRLVDYGGFMGMTYTDGELRNIPDVRKEKEYFCAVGETKSEIVVPIKIFNRVIGVINSESEMENYYNEAIVSKLTSLSWAFAVGIKKLGYNINVSYKDIPYIDRQQSMSQRQENSFIVT